MLIKIKHSLVVIAAPLLLLVSAILMPIQAQEDSFDNEFLTMYVGDTETIDFGPIKRVAVGQGGLISTSILDDGALLILGEGEGETELTVWLESGDIYQYKVLVNKDNLDRVAGEIGQLISKVNGATQRRVGNRIILEGNVDEKGKEALKLIGESLYPDIILDMTRQAQVGTQKMIYMKVQITEFNTNKLRNLGINWQNSFSGPTLAFARESVFNDAGELSVLNVPPSGVNLSLPEGRSNVSVDEFGFFGIASQITSAINLARNSGDAIILAEPSLSARSGGSAEFLSGGEIPLPVVSNDGQANVEFKEFGIILRIKPTADDAGNIIAEVETELSTVDPSLAVNGIPGFRTRKASTDASLKNGQTLVISGLINKQISENITGLEFLSRIPILGQLFRSTEFRNNKSELVIFVTPYIFDEASDINKEAIQKGLDLQKEFLENVNKTNDILE